MIAPVPSALSSALAGLRRCARAADTAARTIASAGLAPPSPSAPPADAAAAPPAPADDVAGAMVDLLVAQRMFAAQCRVIRAADETMRTAADLGRSPGR